MNGAAGRLKTKVLIIGGGAAGSCLARDLSLRGVECVLVEKSHINAGASGANHGLLHSGARYVSNDPGTARECRSESLLLKRLAPHCCEDTGGLFVAVAGDREAYIADFPQLCERCGIEAEAIDRREAREIEPELSENIIAAYRVADATVDPFRLSFDNISDATAHGARLLTGARAVAMELGAGRIRSVRIRREGTGEEFDIEAEQVVNASGAWVGEVAGLAGAHVPVLWSKGSMIITRGRIADPVINRLRPPADGDIVVPGGTVSLAGTTSVRVDDIERLEVSISEVDFLVDEAARMVPAVKNTRLIRAFAGVRPLLCGSATVDDRCVGRGMEIIDHEADGLSNFLSIAGGKLTTCRLTAEKAADLVCKRLGVDAPCLTAELPLPASPVNAWVAAGLAPGLWRSRNDVKDPLLCECEMLPGSAVTQIVEQLRADGEPVNLNAIRLRSRMGKGSCQGAFCGLRVLEFLYDLGVRNGDEGIRDLKEFLESRWKGLRPVLWGGQMAQEQLQEAIYCGLFNLETEERSPVDGKMNS